MNSSLALTFIASLLLLLGHLTRTVRWRMILSSLNIYTTNKKPLFALTLGYNLGIFTPLFMGDIARSFFLASFQRIDPVLTLITVIYERTIDLVIVTTALVLVAIIVNDGAGLPINFLLLSMIVVLLALSVRRSEIARKLIYQIFSLFNFKIRNVLMHFTWNLSTTFSNRSLNRNLQFWFLTLIMWAMYMFSLLLFCFSINVSFKDIFLAIYGEPGLQSFLDVLGKTGNVYIWQLGIYLALPPIVVSSLFVFDLRKHNQSKDTILKFEQVPNYLVASVKRNLPYFHLESDYTAYLLSKFEQEKSLQTAFVNESLEEFEIHRIFQGGSTAITSLLEKREEIFVRKFAPYDVQNNLEVQVRWLEQYANELPLVNLRNTLRNGKNGIFYDMEFKSSARDFYDVINTNSIKTSHLIFDDILNRLNQFHTSHEIKKKSADSVEIYHSNKVTRNLEILKSISPELFDGSVTLINGKKWKPEYLRIIQSGETFRGLIKNQSQSIIHGDLTIENIMIDLEIKNFHESWFLIDPNPATIFSSPLNDFSKLFQSLNLGYESLNRFPNFTQSNGIIEIPNNVSDQYRQLNTRLVEFLVNHYGKIGLVETKLHEITDYLRLIPYQSKKNKDRGKLFSFALGLLLIEFNENQIKT